MKSTSFKAGIALCGAVTIYSAALAGCSMNAPIPAAGTTPAGAAAPVVTAPVATAPASSDSDAAKPASPLQATIATDKASYKAGEKVTFTITLRNTGRTAQNLTFSSGQSFDVFVRPQGEPEAEPLWYWSHDRMFTMALRNMILGAGEEKTWTTSWKQVDNAGKQLPRGSYSVIGRVTANGGFDSALLTVKLTD